MSTPDQDGTGDSEWEYEYFRAQAATGGSIISTSHRPAMTSSRGQYSQVEFYHLDPIPEEHPGRSTSYRSQNSSLYTSEDVTPDTRSDDRLLPTADEMDVPWRDEQQTLVDAWASIKPDPVGSEWPWGVKAALFLATIMLLLNASITLWASSTGALETGIGTFYVGQCSNVMRMNLGGHILINVLATLVLAANNYVLQCLNSPTRAQIDRQHARRQWLEIGVLSLRNLRFIEGRKVLLWALLAASTAPMHWLYNSSVFIAQSTNNYVVVAATESFLADGNWTLTATGDAANFNVTRINATLHSIQDALPTYERLDPDACVKSYGIDFLTARRHVVLVTDSQSDTDSATNSVLGVMRWNYSDAQDLWICGASLSSTDRPSVLKPQSGCTVATAMQSVKKGEGIKFADRRLKNCLSEKIPDECRLQFSLVIMLVVIACNLIQLLCVFFTLMKPQKALVTLGDAITNFLEYPDLATKGLCTITLRDAQRGYWPDMRRGIAQPEKWVCRRPFRWQAVGIWTWASTCIFSFLVLGILGALASKALDTATSSRYSFAWDMDVATVAHAALVRWNSSAGGGVERLQFSLLANLPQLLLSSLYLAWNRILTYMASGKEWASFWGTRQSLRVSGLVRGWQRRTRFLTLPWRYSITAMVWSTAIHLLMSQALFGVAVDVYDYRNLEQKGAIRTPGEGISTIGFSVGAMLVLLIISGALVITVTALGWLRLGKRGNGMPVVGASTVGISAACHVGEGEEGSEIAQRGVRWGVIGTKGGVGHLGFSMGWVGEPIPGRLYL